MKPRAFKAFKAVQKVRQSAGLVVYDVPLTPATCPKCERTYYWRVVPDICPRPGCQGRLR